MFKLTRAKYIEALESVEEMQTALETEMENLGISCATLTNNWFGQQAEKNISLINTSISEGNHAKAYAYTKGMAQVMGEYLPEIEKMMAKREQIGQQLYQDSYYTPDLSSFEETELIVDYAYIDDIKADAEGAVSYAEKAAEILEKMIEAVEGAAADYVNLSDVKELLETGKKEIKRIENYRDEFADFGNKMSDLEYNMSYDLAAIMRGQGDTIILDNPMVMTELDLKERTRQMEVVDYQAMLQQDEEGNYLFEELLDKRLEELTEEEIKLLAELYVDAYEQFSSTEDSQISTDIVLCFTENLFQFTEETDGIINHYYVNAKDKLICTIVEEMDSDQEAAIYSLESLCGTKLEIKRSWFESDWKEWGSSVTELKDFKSDTDLIDVALVKTDIGIQTILYAYPKAGNREKHADEGYKVIYEKELYELSLVDRCVRSGYIMTLEEEKQIEKEVKEYFSIDENKFARDLALTFGPDGVLQSSKVDYTEKELEEFRKMYYLYHKTSDKEAFSYGFYSNFLLTQPLTYGGVLDRLTGYRDDGSHEREYLETAVEQNRISYMAGSILGGGASYVTGASIMKKIPGAGRIFTKAGEKLSKLPVIGAIGAESLTNILADTTLDTAIDTIPSMVELALNGERGGEIVKEGIKKTGISIGVNGAFESVYKLGKGITKGIKKIDNITPNTDTKEIEQAVKGVEIGTDAVEEIAEGAFKGGKGAQGVGNPVAVEGRGNTGRTVPNTLNEQMAMNQVQSNPLEGATKVPLEMTDPRWPASEGWVKMQSVVQNADGTKTTIHYVYNEITGAFDDFKFK